MAATSARLPSSRINAVAATTATTALPRRPSRPLSFLCSVKDTSSGLVIDAITHVHIGGQDPSVAAAGAAAIAAAAAAAADAENGEDDDDGPEAAAAAMAVVSASSFQKKASWAMAGVAEPGVLFLHPKAGHVLGQYKASACKAAECEAGKQVSLTVTTHDSSCKVLLLRTDAATALARLLARIGVPVTQVGDADDDADGDADVGADVDAHGSANASSPPAPPSCSPVPAIELERPNALAGEVATLRGEVESLREYGSRLVAQLGRREAKYALLREEHQTLRRRHKAVVREVAEEKAAKAQLQKRCQVLEKKLAEKLAEVVGMSPRRRQQQQLRSRYGGGTEAGCHLDRIHSLEEELKAEKASKAAALEANEHLLGKIQEREAVLNRLQTDIDALQVSPAY